MAKDNKTLHLVLKRKWWDMIASGEKKEEYRDVCHYWARRLLDEQYRWYSQNIDYPNDFIDWLCFGLTHNDIAFRSYENVCFHLGYKQYDDFQDSVNECYVRRGMQARLGRRAKQVLFRNQTWREG